MVVMRLDSRFTTLHITLVRLLMEWGWNTKPNWLNYSKDLCNFYFPFRFIVLAQKIYSQCIVLLIIFYTVF